jgi:hypothetical protein
MASPPIASPGNADKKPLPLPNYLINWLLPCVTTFDVWVKNCIQLGWLMMGKPFF